MVQGNHRIKFCVKPANPLSPANLRDISSLCQVCLKCSADHGPRTSPAPAPQVSLSSLRASKRVFPRPLPWWALIALPRAWRPRKSWTWARTMHMNFIRHISKLSDIVGSVGILKAASNHLTLLPGVGFHGVWVDPVPLELVQGKVKSLASVAVVSPVKLPGYWVHKPGTSIKLEAPLMPGEKIVYSLHGGGYVSLSAHPTDPTAGIVRGLLERVDSIHRTFAIEYRLSSTTPYPVANPFPAALLDALTGYNYLVNTLRISPSDIILEGDSAGGNLALALVRYLSENTSVGLPVPSALLLFSPWTDLGTSHALPGSPFITCVASDYVALPPKGGQYSVRAFTEPFGIGIADSNPYISPASTFLYEPINFAGFPPTFISCGGAEVLQDSIRELSRRMTKDLGDHVKYLEAEDGVHDFVVFDNGLHDPERSDTLNVIAEWVAAR
ncbi:Alpha/Beta hydrolase protein [Mycena maculata]|uniref:Alpha/Beta hydrolase protein n=1 Tax=Mycena maculata TaxID=230809 RepID=A0AAD7N2U7_9AGAR|nr:Alpha/Beta hydrolase protein [Mycena maculata]